MKDVWWLVALGGGLGSVARFAVSGWVAARTGDLFPWGTLVVNVAGSVMIGFLAQALGPEGVWMARPAWRVFWLAGVLGGFTTFSSFSLQTLELMMDRQWAWAAGNAAMSVGLCLAGAWVGMAAGRALG